MFNEQNVSKNLENWITFNKISHYVFHRLWVIELTCTTNDCLLICRIWIKFKTKILAKWLSRLSIFFSAFSLRKKATVRTLSVRPSQPLVFRGLTALRLILLFKPGVANPRPRKEFLRPNLMFPYFGFFFTVFVKNWPKKSIFLKSFPNVVQRPIWVGHPWSKQKFFCKEINLRHVFVSVFP